MADTENYGIYVTFVLFSPVTFAVFEANKSSSEMKKAGSAPLDQVVRFFFFSCGKGVLRFLAVQPHACEQVKKMGEYTWFQLFSKRDRRSSLLLLGKSGGSRYESSSSGFVSSGSSYKIQR